MNFSLYDTLVIFLLVIGFIGFTAFVYRIVSFYLVIFFGKNIRITFIDENGLKTTKKYRLDKNDELLELIEAIKSKSEYKRQIYRVISQN